MYDISAYIIPLNAVSYGVERLAAVLCFSVENQPKPLLWSWLSQSMNEWIRYESKSHKRERAEGTRRGCVFCLYELVVTLLNVHINSPHMAVTHKGKFLITFRVSRRFVKKEREKT